MSIQRCSNIVSTWKGVISNIKSAEKESKAFSAVEVNSCDDAMILPNISLSINK